MSNGRSIVVPVRPVVSGLMLALGLSLPGAGTAQGPGTENGGWRYLGGDAWHTATRPPARSPPRTSRSWSWPGDSTRPALARPPRGHREPRRRQADHGVRRAPRRGRARCRNRRDGVDILRAEDRPVGLLDARRLRKRRCNGRGRRTRGGLHLDTRFLPPRARRRDRPAARELGGADPPPRFSALRERGPSRRPHRGLGPLAGLRGRGGEYDADAGLPLALGYITSSSPPIVVNDVVSSGTRPSRATTRRASRTCRATSSAMTRAPGNSSGNST